MVKLDEALDNIAKVSTEIEFKNNELNCLKLKPVSRMQTQDGKDIIFKQSKKGATEAEMIPYTPPKGGVQF